MVSQVSAGWKEPVWSLLLLPDPVLVVEIVILVAYMPGELRATCQLKVCNFLLSQAEV